MTLTELLGLWDYEFMRRAWVTCLALSFGTAPLGVFLVLRRMSLMGDALSHAMLPGVALGFTWFGASIWAMSAGGLLAAAAVALVAGLLTRITTQREDASFAAMYMLALALGVLILAKVGTPIDLLQVLFGNLLAVDDDSMLLVAGSTTVTLWAVALAYRQWVTECVDPLFMRTQNRMGGWFHLLFLLVLVINLVAGFQAMGTLLVIGLLVFPALAARFWVRELPSLMVLSWLFALLGSTSGLVFSFFWDIPSGPAIILFLGALYFLSTLLGGQDSWRAKLWRRHSHHRN